MGDTVERMLEDLSDGLRMIANLFVPKAPDQPVGTKAVRKDLLVGVLFLVLTTIGGVLILSHLV